MMVVSMYVIAEKPLPEGAGIGWAAVAHHQKDSDLDKNNRLQPPQSKQRDHQIKRIYINNNNEQFNQYEIILKHFLIS